ncbi:MAG: glycosyltransferase family 2 protein [Chitinophagales bacterium]|nr:glycosyltransferase family 2 protein [Chitinophagales bacterium]MCZ2394301.1 glycosyltransferase family 2 protein [Chitinophagales bacterium]
MQSLSVIIPIFNEEENIRALYERINQTITNIHLTDFEIIFINDGSKDSSISIIKSLAANDSHIKYIDLSRNFGHQNAVFAGMKYAKKETVVIIDADLQDPPEVIETLYQKLMEGYDVVYAQRMTRKGESWHKLLTAKYFYLFLEKLSDTPIPLDTGDFRIMTNKVNQTVCNMPERNKFLRGQIAWTGFNQTYIEYERQARFSGTTKYSYAKMFKFAMDGISAFSNFPLKLSTWMGFFTALVAVGMFIYTLYVRLFTNDFIKGWSSLMVTLLFIGGIQLICIGILGEYLGRVLDNVRGRPPFVVKDSNISEVKE